MTLTLTEYLKAALLSDDDRVELLATVATRGKNKGRIKTSLPARGKPGRLAWNAVMLTVCPQRAAVWSLMFEIRTDGTSEQFDRIEAWCKANKLALEVLGTRPYQFSLWEHHYDRERVLTLVRAFHEDGHKRGPLYRSAMDGLKQRDADEVATDEQGELFPTDNPTNGDNNV